MSSVRLRADQVERLRKSDPAQEIKLAVKRWRAGEIVAGNCNKREYRQNLLQLNLWKRPEGVTDAQLREILDAHWNNPARPDIRDEITALDEFIEKEMALLQVPYVVKREEFF